MDQTARPYVHVGHENLRIRDGGVCIHDTSVLVFFLNIMRNIAPAIAGDADQPSLWPSLRDKAFGPDLLQHGPEGGGWTYFFRTETPMQRICDRRQSG